MKTSLKGLIEIASHEGIVNYPYKDTKGIWTVGIGHTKMAGLPDPAINKREYSVKEIFEIFAKDMAKFEARVNDAVKVPITQHEYDALVSFDFNTGGIYKAKLTQLLNKGDHIGAAQGFMGWVKPPELRGRRLKEQTLFAKGIYSAGGKANLIPADSNGKPLYNRGKPIDVESILKSLEPSQQPPVVQPEPILEELESVISFTKADLSKITLLDLYKALKTLNGDD